MLCFIGTHIATLSGGNQCALDIVAAELYHLWETGFYSRGTHYVVALIIFGTDGRGFEEVFRVVGGGSKWGSIKTREASGTSFQFFTKI